MTLHGWDASHYDGTLTRAILARAKAEGIDFFHHKIAEGLSDTEGTHDDTALAAARDAGIPFVGGYLVPRTLDSAAQVDYWVRQADAGEPWWRDFGGWYWVDDLERWSYDNVSAAKGIDTARRLRDKTGRQVLLYASHGQYGDQLAAWDGPLINADYTGRPAAGFVAMYPGDGWRPSHGGWTGGWAPYSGREPAILQYTSSATIAGLTTCDANAFRGDVAAFARLVGGSSTNVSGGDLMANASEIIVAWSGGFPKTSDGQVVAPVDWRLRDEAWQRDVSGQLAADKVRDTALAAAVQALAVGAGIDGPGLLAQIEERINAAVAPLRQQLADAHAELAAVRQAAVANLSPAERAAIEASPGA